MNSADSKKCKDSIRKLFASIESEDHAGGFEIVSLSQTVPSLFYNSTRDSIPRP